MPPRLPKPKPKPKSLLLEDPDPENKDDVGAAAAAAEDKDPNPNPPMFRDTASATAGRLMDDDDCTELDGGELFLVLVTVVLLPPLLLLAVLFLPLPFALLFFPVLRRLLPLPLLLLLPLDLARVFVLDARDLRFVLFRALDAPLRFVPRRGGMFLSVSVEKKFNVNNAFFY